MRTAWPRAGGKGIGVDADTGSGFPHGREPCERWVGAGPGHRPGVQLGGAGQLSDRDAASWEVAALQAGAAGSNRADLVVFPETFVSVYPSSSWARALAGWNDPRAKAAFAALARSAVEVPGPAADRLGAIAREHGVWLVTGVNELDPARNATVYNALLYHAPDGTLALKHRKLVPTNHERLVWGQGDGGGLRARDTARPARRARLLGELHAARPLRAVRRRG